MEGLYRGGTLTHRGRHVQFLYPASLSWSCTKCGRCCRDNEKRGRRILLLESDIRRIHAAGAEGFHETTGQEPFTGLMRMRDGACVFLTPHGCSIYQARALLCRMYPFWVERLDDGYVIHVDPDCPGLGGGSELGECFYAGLLADALAEMSP
jgi:hypothetical protein